MNSEIGYPAEKMVKWPTFAEEMQSKAARHRERAERAIAEGKTGVAADRVRKAERCEELSVSSLALRSTLHPMMKVMMDNLAEKIAENILHGR